MAVLTVQTLSHGLSAGTYSGLTPTYASCASGGDSFANDGRTFIHIKNGHSSPQTVTIASNVNCNMGHDHDVAVAVTNAEERMIGPFRTDQFNDGNARVTLTYSGVTSLTIAVIKLATEGR